MHSYTPTIGEAEKLPKEAGFPPLSKSDVQNLELPSECLLMHLSKQL